MSKLSRSSLLVLCIAAALSAGLVNAQTFTGSILGTVTDASGALVQGATVRVVETSTTVERTVRSDDKGYFEVPLLPPGVYSVNAEMAGFKKYSRAGVKLDIDARAEVAITLVPGEISQTVQVQAEAPLLETTSSSVSQVVEAKQVSELPSANRNLFQIAELTPGLIDFSAGAAPATSGSVGFGNWASNGGLSNTNEFMVDGATAVTANMSAASIIPTIDAIAEIKVITNSLAAEFGRSGGAVLNAIYKSGSNQLHGSAYDFWKNRVLNANSWVNNKNGLPVNFTNVNTFGYTFGGPVYIPKVFDGRNKLFFFTNFEGYRDVLPGSTLLTVPTAIQKAGDFSQTFTVSGQLIQIYDPTTTTLVPGTTSTYTRSPYPDNKMPASQINPTAAKIIQYFPNPNAIPTNIAGANNYLAVYSAKDRQNMFAIKTDYNLNTSQRLFVRFTQSSQGGGAANYFGNTPPCTTCLKQGNPAGSVSPRGGGSDLFIYPKNVVVGYTWSVTPTSLLDLRYSLNRQLLARLPQSSGFDLSSLGWPSSLVSQVYYAQFPAITISNYSSLGSASNGDLLRRADLSHSTEGSITLIRHSHTIKAGGDFRMYRYNDLQATDNTPSFSFGPAATQQNPSVASGTSGWSLASMLYGQPSGGTYTIPAAVALQYFYSAAYIQDDWRVSNRLTFNLGLRYDLETPFTERYNRLSYWDPTVSELATQKLPSAVGGLQYVAKDTSSRYRSNLDKNNFGPRAGFALKLTNRTVLRGGYGIMYQPTMDTGFGAATFGAVGYNSTTSYTSSNNGGVTFFANLTNPYPNGFVQPTGNSLGANTLLGQAISNTQLRDQVVPYSQQYNLGVQHQIRNWVFNVTYVGSQNVHQFVNVQLNQLYPTYFALGTGLNIQKPNPFLGLITVGGFTSSTLSTGQLLLPYPQFGNIAVNQSSQGQSNYNSLQNKVEKRFSNGLSLTASFTWSKNITNAGVPYNYGASVQNQYNLAAERGLSPIDVAHRTVFGYTYELPFGKGKALAHSLNGFLNILVAGWQINGITTFQSGLPLLINNAPTNTIGFNAGQRISNNGHSALLPSDQRTQNRWFDTSVFYLPASYTFGNTGRYSPDLRNPNTNTWNTSFFKNTTFRERYRLQFRAEFFNLMNHPIWAAPGTTINTSTFGVVAQKNGNRTGQLGLKLLF
jgi:hypothetical protein